MSGTPQQVALDGLAETARTAGLPWQDSWRPPLTQLLTWLARFSARTNLVGDHTPTVVAREHLLESLTVAAAVERAGVTPARVVDVGAGAGLEMLVLGLWAPDAALVAVEPRRKRADFIELVADAMGMGRRLSVIRDQVPPWRPDVGFDLATSRATFAPADWLAHGGELVRPAGLVVVHAAIGSATIQRQPRDPTTARTRGLVLLHEVVVPQRPAHCIRTYTHVGDTPAA